ncbi:hypothetical protein LXL04_003219 [Taraxacum kok-saghyz]
MHNQYADKVIPPIPYLLSLSQSIDDACDLGLPNLKTLGLKTTLGAFTFNELIQILKYYPKLEILKLTIFKDFDEECQWLDEAETRRLWTPDVKKVELFEFNGEKPKVVVNWCEGLSASGWFVYPGLLVYPVVSCPKTSTYGVWAIQQGMKKSELEKASKREDGVDLISKMPDAILLLILSRVSSIEEQIRSSILSRRWRHLWTAIPSLDISYTEIRYGGKFKKGEFKEFVYWVLVNKSVDLDSFSLRCADYYSMSTVWRWVHVAVKRNVKQLNFFFYTKEKTEAVELPHCLVSCASLEVLKLNLRNRGLIWPKGMGFPALRVLDLTDVDLLEDEDLLKRLSIINWEDVGCHGIEISCPELVDLDLTGHIACKSFFEPVHSLKKAVIEPKLVGNTISVLFPGICRLTSTPSCINVACDSGLPNLKTLVLNTTMDAFSMDNLNLILKNSPKLEFLKVYMEQIFHGKYKWLDEAETRRILTGEVKIVEFFEFNGQKPKLVIDWYEDEVDMFFTWGDKANW